MTAHKCNIFLWWRVYPSLQHRLLVSDCRMQAQMILRSKKGWKRKIWNLKDPLNSQRFWDFQTEAFDDHDDLQMCNIEDSWKLLQDNIVRDTDQIDGWCKVPSRPIYWVVQSSKQTNIVDNAIRANKKRLGRTGRVVVVRSYIKQLKGKLGSWYT